MTTPPKCRKCQSTDISATSSQQMRKVKGVQKLHAEAICDHCGHSWWSVHPAIKALARKADKARTA